MKSYNRPAMVISMFDKENVTTSAGGGTGTEASAYSSWAKTNNATTKKLTLGEMESVTVNMAD